MADWQKAVEPPTSAHVTKERIVDRGLSSAWAPSPPRTSYPNKGSNDDLATSPPLRSSRHLSHGTAGCEHTEPSLMIPPVSGGSSGGWPFSRAWSTCPGSTDGLRVTGRWATLVVLPIGPTHTRSPSHRFHLHTHTRNGENSFATASFFKLPDHGLGSSNVVHVTNVATEGAQALQAPR